MTTVFIVPLTAKSELYAWLHAKVIGLDGSKFRVVEATALHDRMITAHS